MLKPRSQAADAIITPSYLDKALALMQAQSNRREVGELRSNQKGGGEGGSGGWP